MTTMQLEVAHDTLTASRDSTELRSRVAGLALVYSLSLDQFDQPDVVREVQALCSVGFVLPMIASCAVIFAASSSEVGLAVPTGAFACSTILQHCEKAVRDYCDQLSSGAGEDLPGPDPTSIAEFSRWLSSSMAELPSLLVASDPTERLVDAVARALPEADIHLDEERDGHWRLRIVPRRSLFEATDTTSSSGALDAQFVDSSVHLIVSPLLCAVAAASGLEADIHDRPMYLRREVDQPAQPLRDAEWRALIPEFPAPLRQTEVPTPTAAGLLRAWLDSFNQEVAFNARMALWVRARLVHALAALTQSCPQAAVHGLLSSAPASVIPCIDAYAARNDIDMSGIHSQSMAREGDNAGEHSLKYGRETQLATSAVTSRAFQCHDDISPTKLGSTTGTLATRNIDADIAIVLLDDSGGAIAILPRILVTAIDNDQWRDELPKNAVTTTIDGCEYLVLAAEASADGNSPVEIIVPLTGIRHDDVKLVSAVHNILDRFPGSRPVSLALTRLAYRKVLPRPAGRGVSISSALEAEIARILGPHSLIFVQ